MSASPVLERSPAAPQPMHAVETSSPAATAGRLYEEYYERVLGYCLYKLGSRPEAEDATQTTFLWALRGLEAGIEPRMEANWLFTIAQNACRARIRTRGRRRRQEVLSDPQVLQQVAPGRPADNDELLGLEDALRDIPELQRQAIVLREWRGLSYKEIAETLDLSLSAVETLIFRARRSLASRLEYRAARKRAGAFAFDLGSIASALKSLLGLGTGAKVAAASSAAALAIGVAVAGDAPNPRQPLKAEKTTAAVPSRAPSTAVIVQTSLAAEPGSGKPTEAPASGATAPSAVAPAPGAAPGPAQTAEAPATIPEAPVSPPVEDTVAAIDHLVGTVAEPVENLTSALPSLPLP